MNDIRNIMPHHKKDVKFDAKDQLYQLNEICDMKNCNNCLFFESRKGSDLYLWVAKSPDGPAAKFHVTNVHTMNELKFSGNCLKGSRPLLMFDKAFDEEPHLRLIKDLFSQVFGTPAMHPRSKPFIDHMLCFYYCGDRIWFRNYQIAEEYFPDKQGKNKTEDALIEIGPRFVMNLIKILSGSFSGTVLYENPKFISPNTIRALQRRKGAGKYVERRIANAQKQAHKEIREFPKDELDEVFYDEEDKTKEENQHTQDGEDQSDKMESDDGDDQHNMGSIDDGDDQNNMGSIDDEEESQDNEMDSDKN